MDTQLFTPADIVYSYTRKQALEDGEQVLLEGELGEMARSRPIGYKYPVYLTRSVWALVEMAASNKKHCNDVKGVIWDILWMSRTYCRPLDPMTTEFRLTITGTGRRRLHTLIIQCGPTDIDDPAPCLTVMHPSEM